jgi:tetratricopeptide (TPR) repeat protein
VTEPAAERLVHVGGYALEVGPGAEPFAHFQPEREDKNATALTEALAEEPEESAVVEGVAAVHDSAEGVTLQVERADAMLRASLAGNPLDFMALTGELDSMLMLLGRLDRDGRFEEQLRLARSLAGLLMVAGRWLQLIRALRSTLRAARSAGSEAGQAWAHRELGSLELCAGNPKAALEHLSQALAFESALGAGSCATRHNYDSARRDEAMLRSGGRRFSRRTLRVAGLVAALMLLGGGGTAIAFAVNGDNDDGGGTITDTDSTSSSSSTGTTSPDTTPPAVALAAPADGAALATATPEFSGAAGTAEGDEPRVVVFVLDAAGSPVPDSPFSADVDGKTWSFTRTGALADGAYTASAQQRDRAGNTGTSAVNAFTIDTDGPLLRLDCPSTLRSNPQTCRVESSDAGTVRIDVYEIFIDIHRNKSEQLLANSPTFDVEAKVLRNVDVSVPPLEGDGYGFRLIAVQTDPAGNTGQSNSEQMTPVE